MQARPPLSRVLFATDLSHDGDLAFAHALRIALAGKGELAIVHAASRDVIGKEWDQFPRVRASLAGWGFLEFGAPASAVEEKLDLRVRKIDIPDPDPHHGVKEVLERRPCDLVVLASHARQGVDRWLHPSLAEPIAREAKAPSLTLPPSAAGFVDPGTGAVSLRNVLVAVDHHPSAARALAIAADLTTMLGAAGAIFHLLHVGEHFPEIPVPDAISARIRSRQQAGPVVDTIIDTASEVDADLIVMATRGHDSLLDSLRGSTTEQVLRNSGRPLLAVPA
jgi:nucleotide-binding universal stress UspA family protein